MKKNHELVIFENGRISLKDLALGESMHSKIGPWEEAHAIYIGQSQLSTRLVIGAEESRGVDCGESPDALSLGVSGDSGMRARARGGQAGASCADSPLVLFDIGLGLAANSLAALQCSRKLLAAGKKVRKLKIISFENDPSGLKLALERREHFPFFAGFEDILEKLLADGTYQSPDQSVEWELRVGDFAKWVQEGFGPGVHPEIIFYDFYSPKTQPGLWRVDYFEALRRAATPNAVLITYSAATSIRIAMILGGFYVGHGVRTGAKLATTMGACRREDLAEPFGKEWIEKIHRSSKVLPYGFSESEREAVLGRVEALI